MTTAAPELSLRVAGAEGAATVIDAVSACDGTGALRGRLIASDLVSVLTAWSSPLVLPGLRDGQPRAALLAGGLGAAIAVAVQLATLAGQGLYRERVRAVRVVELQRVARATMLTTLVVIAAAQTMDGALPGRRILAGGALALLALTASRTSYAAWLARARRAGRYALTVALVGADEHTSGVARTIREHPELGYRVVGVVAPRAASATLDLPWLGDDSDVVERVRRAGAAGVMIVTTALSPSRLNDTIRAALGAGLHVHLCSGLRGFAARRLRVLPFDREPLLYLEPVALSRWQVSAKRALDVAVGSAALVAALPVLAVAAAAIKFEDRGPLLFSQLRVGRDGREFRLYKLRTMVPDAERRLHDLRHRNVRADGPLFKVAGDPRVTRVGRFLRASSIDELPQLVNVLRGSMSLVGPRPALPNEMRLFDDHHQTRTQVPPGITGLWQVEGRDDPSFGTYRRLDLFYVENWSVGLDLVILGATAGAVLARTARSLQAARAAGRTVVLD